MSRPTFVERLAQRRGVRQFVKFALVGLSGLAVNFLVFTVLQRLVPNHSGGVEFTTIYSIAFLSGGASNYFLNRAWTFRSTGHVGLEGLSFMTVSVVALVVGLLVSAAIAPELGRGHKTWFISTIAGIVVNFFANKYWTFRAAA